MKGVTAAILAEEICDRLKQARLNRDLTQSEVAAHAGVLLPKIETVKSTMPRTL